MSLAFLSLTVGKLTFTQNPLHVHSDQPLSRETLIWFKHSELCSLCLSKLLTPKKRELPEGSLGTLGVLCHLYLL